MTDIRVTQVGADVLDVGTATGVQVTQAGALALASGAALAVSQVGALALAKGAALAVTQAGALILIAPDLATRPAETITITERVVLHLQKTQVESVTVTEFVKLQIVQLLTAFEVLFLQENVRLRLGGGRQVQDAISLVEFVRMDLSIPLPLAVSESVAVTEFIKTVLTPLVLRAAEAITVLEAFTTGRSGMQVLDRIHVSDVVALGLNRLSVHVTDTISINEGPFNASSTGSAGGLGPSPPPVSVAGDYWIIGI